jgi:uncharacterized protein (DUF433 family)
MFSRIISNPSILGGKPIVLGTRLSVEFILELIASGASRKDIVRAYPQLSEADVEEAVRYAMLGLKNEVLLTAQVVP